MNAYAAIVHRARLGDEILYFGLERNANTGTANVGFWFLQDDVACESTGGAVTFSGAHTDGDLLIVSEFTGGGTVSTINVYRWNGGADGSLGATPSPVVPTSTAESTTLAYGRHRPAGRPTRRPITTPVAHRGQDDRVGHTLPTAQFFEAGLNLTDRCWAASASARSSATPAPRRR